MRRSMKSPMFPRSCLRRWKRMLRRETAKKKRPRRRLAAQQGFQEEKARERDCGGCFRAGVTWQRVAVCAAGAGRVAQEERRGHIADYLRRLQCAAGHRDCARLVS